MGGGGFSNTKIGKKCYKIGIFHLIFERESKKSHQFWTFFDARARKKFHSFINFKTPLPLPVKSLVEFLGGASKKTLSSPVFLSRNIIINNWDLLNALQLIVWPTNCVSFSNFRLAVDPAQKVMHLHQVVMSHSCLWITLIVSNFTSTPFAIC